MVRLGIEDSRAAESPRPTAALTVSTTVILGKWDIGESRGRASIAVLVRGRISEVVEAGDC